MKVGMTKQEISNEEQLDIINFGKYRGSKISNLPIDYIIFVIKKCDRISPALKDRLYEELDKRKEELPCYLKLYDPISSSCSSCPFMEECADACYYEERV